MYLNIKHYVDTQKDLISSQIKSKSITFGIIMVGTNPASQKYVDNKLKDCNAIGITAVKHQFKRLSNSKDYNILLSNILTLIKKYDKVMIQLPIEGATPEQSLNILNLLPRAKDVDGLSSHSPYQPCTPKGIIDYIDRNYKQQPCSWTLFGNGKLVGKPMSKIIQSRVEDKYFIIDSKSTPKAIELALGQSDIVVCAVGKNNFLDLKEERFDKKIVFDCGINFVNGKMCGDCINGDRQGVTATSVPGGVGLLTRLALLENIIKEV